MLAIFADQLFSVGGPILIALGALSIVALTATFYKIAQFIRLGVGKHDEARKLVERWRKGDREGALKESGRSDLLTTQVLHAALAALSVSPGNYDGARRNAVQAATERLAVLGKHMRILEAVVQAAPMLGLLGTVIGMIDAFGKLSEASGAVDPALLAGGIWVALTTTAVGLTVAIPFYFLSIWFEGRIEAERAAMESVLFAALNAVDVNDRTAGPF